MVALSNLSLVRSYPTFLLLEFLTTPTISSSLLHFNYAYSLELISHPFRFYPLQSSSGMRAYASRAPFALVLGEEADLLKLD